MEILENISLESYNTFGVEARARFFIEIKNKEHILTLFADKTWKEKPILLLGQGSNVLFITDYPGLVLKISIPGITILNEDRDFIELEVGSGVLWNGFINWCLERNYFGLENLTHIPGCVGAAPVQNIGAYGAEISQVIQEVRGIFTKTSEEKIFSKDECHFKYRSSIFKEVYHNQFIITSVLFKLSKKHEPNLKFHEVRKRLENLNIAAPTAHEIRNVIHEIRQEKLPDPARLGNAGSFFKNPEITKQKLMALKNEFPEINSYPIPDAPEKVKISAAFLIEKCAWKGKVYGHCGVYDKQPLVLVNLANALGQEIWELAQLIMQDVQTRFAIQLETEVNIIGPGF